MGACFVKVNQSSIKTIDVKDATFYWIRSQQYDSNLKILKIENCPDLHEVHELTENLACSKAFGNLPVLVLQVHELAVIDAPYPFLSPSDRRPQIMQINFPDESKMIFVKDHKSHCYSEISINITPFVEVFKEMVEVHGNFDGDILTAEMTRIPENSFKSKEMAASDVCLRFASLFEGGVNRIMPWLKVETIQGLPEILAFVDYPSDPEQAVELAWETKRFDHLKLFISRDFRFPKKFDINQIDPENREEFKKIVDQRQKLHRSISEKNIEEVSKILGEIEKDGGWLKRAYNTNNDPAITTALKNADPNIYTMLLEKKLEFEETRYANLFPMWKIVSKTDT